MTPTAVVRGGMRRHRETAEAWPGAGWRRRRRRRPGTSSTTSAWSRPTRTQGRPATWTGASSSGSSSSRRRAGPAAATTASTPSRGRPSAGGCGLVRAACAQAGSGRHGRGGHLGRHDRGRVCRAGRPGRGRGAYARLWSRFNTVLVNSSVTRVVVGSTGPRLLTFNEHPHLEGGRAHLPLRGAGMNTRCTGCASTFWGLQPRERPGVPDHRVFRPGGAVLDPGEESVSGWAGPSRSRRPC